jgi:hypothetical protein
VARPQGYDPKASPPKATTQGYPKATPRLEHCPRKINLSSFPRRPHFPGSGERAKDTALSVPCIPLSYCCRMAFYHVQKRRKMPLRLKTTAAIFLFLYLVVGGWNSLVWCSQTSLSTIQPSGRAAGGPVAESQRKDVPSSLARARIDGTRQCLKLPPALASAPSPEISGKPSPVPPSLSISTLPSAFVIAAAQGGGRPTRLPPRPSPQLEHIRTVVLLN